MQRMFEISLKVDYADPSKHETMQKAVIIAARHVLATASLLAEGVKPQIAVTGDDFFTGTQKIELFEDLIGQGKAAMAATEGTEEVVEEKISDELLNALKPDVMGA